MENSIKILGAFGSKSNDLNSTCIQLTEKVLIDAGNIVAALGVDSVKIEHIILSHSHLDHILDIPFLIDSFYEKREKPLIIYGIKDTISDVKKYILNEKIWPDFSKINLLHSNEKSIIFKEVDYGDILEFENVSVKIIPNNHTSSSCAFVITKEDDALLFSSDTYHCDSIWDEINTNKKIKTLIIDVSFPSKFEKIAYESKHLTPKLLKQELNKLKRNDVTIHVNHLKPLYISQIKQELYKLNIFYNNGTVLRDLDIINLKTSKVIHTFDSTKKQIEYLNKIGHALTSEKNFDSLMDKILRAAKDLTQADAGTIYLVSDDEKYLKFKIVHTDSLHLQMGGTGESINWPDLPLYNDIGEKNADRISVKCALENILINIPDVYSTENYNFVGPRLFDKNTNYRTKSMLVVPLVNNDNDVIGVLQLINKKDKFNEITEFNHEDEKLILSMGSQAAVAISNMKLVKGLEDLLNSFMQTIATAIGEKSKYTQGHVNRVAEITADIANAINKDKKGLYKDIKFDPDQLRELDVASWMHDIGKISTPEYVVDKRTKLETIHDRIHLVKAKFEIIKRDLELQLYKNLSKVSNKIDEQKIKDNYDKQLTQLDDDLNFLEHNNFGSEFTTDDKIERIINISKKELVINGEKYNLLSEDEVKNMTIRKGTLTQEERDIINAHARLSVKMLETMPFPKKLRNVPTIAGGHHEKICGGGYPNNLKGDEICLEARILAIADIFEALTAHDRPYKKPNTLNQALRILYFMAKDDELDRNLVKFFIEEKIYEQYIEYNLMPSQMDEITVDVSDL